MSYITFYTIILMGITTGLLILFHECIRKYIKLGSIIFIILFITFPFWYYKGIPTDNLPWFTWIKTLSVLFCVVIIGLLRYSYSNKNNNLNFLRSGVFFWILWIGSFINILEAIILDYINGYFFNGLAGLLLIATIPFSIKPWSIDNKYKKNDLIVNFPIAWSVFYVIWNACFVYGNYPTAFAIHICILCAPLFYILTKRSELFIGARIYTLATYFIIRANYDFIPRGPLDSSSWANVNIALYWGFFNAIILCIFAIWWFMWGYGAYKNKYLK